MQETIATAAEIKDLIRSESFQDFGKQVNRFDIFRAFNIQDRELSYSDLIAYLLNLDEPRGFGKELFQLLMQRIGDTECSATEFHVFRERANLDILIEGRNTVVAIENKIHAPEGRNQLQTYQSWLADRYPSHSKLLLFLSPTGREPISHDPRSKVPVKSFSYGDLAQVLDRCADQSNLNDGSELSTFLKHIATHFREHVMGGDSLKREARKIWADGAKARAIYELMNHEPKLDEIINQYSYEARELVNQIVGAGSEPKTWGEQKPTTAIGLQIVGWEKSQLPIVFMLHQWRNYFSDMAGRFALLTLVKDEHVRDTSNYRLKDLESWSRHGTNDSRISFQSLPSSPWCKVWADDPVHSPGVVIKDVETIENTVKSAISALELQLNRTAALIDGYLKVA